MNGEITVNKVSASDIRQQLSRLSSSIDATISELKKSKMGVSDGGGYESLEDLTTELIAAVGQLKTVVGRTDGFVDKAMKLYVETDESIARQF